MPKVQFREATSTCGLHWIAINTFIEAYRGLSFFFFFFLRMPKQALSTFTKHFSLHFGNVMFVCKSQPKPKPRFSPGSGHTCGKPTVFFQVRVKTVSVYSKFQCLRLGRLGGFFSVEMQTLLLFSKYRGCTCRAGQGELPFSLFRYGSIATYWKDPVRLQGRARL